MSRPDAPRPDSSERNNRRVADPTDAKEDRRRGLRNTLPIEKASGGTGVRTDQTGTRLPPVPVAGHRESSCRVGHDLHGPQPPQAVHPREGRLSRLSCNKCPVVDGLLAGYSKRLLVSEMEAFAHSLDELKGRSVSCVVKFRGLDPRSIKKVSHLVASRSCTDAPARVLCQHSPANAGKRKTRPLSLPFGINKCGVSEKLFVPQLRGG